MTQSKMSKVSICGCGWLGLPLAKHFVQLGIETWGSKQAVGPALELAEYGIHGVALSLPLSLELPALSPPITSFFDTDLLVINIPPGRYAGAVEEWVAKVKRLSAMAKQVGCRKVIFISTTAVYGECQGTVDEWTEPRPNTLSGKAHLAVEQYLRTEWGNEVVILRLAGLIGPRRHPVRYLSGRQGIENGKDRVNLIHQEDCIAAISQMAVRWPHHPVMHLAAPQHPSREDYYQQMAQLAGLPLPEFINSPERNSKVIDAGKTCEWLSLRIRHADLLSERPDI
ncbi:hypothetical protein H744_2c1433 [Photobacterium gaetbulicola Gung47]|uniref:NAD-dependent epimerase/dehydratase domain-containing protein n=1 Tax=Photobacterium gaetbulicola Gung47 TaxID=658445 RepID=A0A0C5W971_9GAMM|nr:NAD-dependent epimerase/dehydratase family protein [Photobacterium gaetbulicola]AJR08111.1 hypothetical protein H744_2c1433 [Photobacterium gaetbulicola Gung47]